jgi:hypothetical protein
MERFVPRLFVTTTLVRSPRRDRPNFLRKCKLKPHSSTQMICHQSAGASLKILCAYCLCACNTLGELRDIGTAQINFAVKPILVKNLAIDCQVTVIANCSASLVHSLDRVKSGRSSTQLSIAWCASVVIFSPLCPPHLFGLLIGASCLCTIACPVLTGSPNVLAADEIEIVGEDMTYCKNRARTSWVTVRMRGPQAPVLIAAALPLAGAPTPLGGALLMLCGGSFYVC